MLNLIYFFVVFVDFKIKFPLKNPQINFCLLPILYHFDYRISRISLTGIVLVFVVLVLVVVTNRYLLIRKIFLILYKQFENFFLKILKKLKGNKNHHKI